MKNRRVSEETPQLRVTTALEASGSATSITGVTMGAVLGVFSLASWVSFGSGVSARPLVWARGGDSEPQTRPERALAAESRGLEGPALSCREYPGAPAKIRDRDQAAHFPGLLNVGGQAAIVYSFYAPPPRAFRLLSSPAAGIGPRNEFLRLKLSGSFRSTFLRWRHLIWVARIIFLSRSTGFAKATEYVAEL